MNAMMNCIKAIVLALMLILLPMTASALTTTSVAPRVSGSTSDSAFTSSADSAQLDRQVESRSMQVASGGENQVSVLSDAAGNHYYVWWDAVPPRVISDSGLQLTWTPGVPPSVCSGGGHVLIWDWTTTPATVRHPSGEVLVWD